jgi:hypothetical protein
VTRGEWIVFGICGFFAVITITALVVFALRDDTDWSDWGKEHNDR